MTESAFIQWLRNQGNSTVPVGPGDDCAVLSTSNRPMLVTTDMLMDVVDFILSDVSPRIVGRKAMAVNLSDIAAMAGLPTAAVVSVALPKTGDIAKELYLGLKEMADEFHVPIVGGDTNAWDGPLVISVTVFGQPHSRIGPVLRSGAKPGDWLFVTGPLGGSILGRHLNPRPRIQEAQRLADQFPLHAMMDISDGLAADLPKLLGESRCGAVLNARKIPIHDDAHQLSLLDGKTALEHALCDGEDFELLFAVAPETGPKVEARRLGIPVGFCLESGMFIQDENGRKPMAAMGWSYSFGND